MKRGIEDGFVKVGVGFEEGVFEVVGLWVELGGVGNELMFVFFVGDNFGKFDLDVFRVFGLVMEVSESIGGGGKVGFFDKVMGRVGEYYEIISEDDGLEELDGNGNVIWVSVGFIFSGVYNVSS